MPSPVRDMGEIDRRTYEKASIVKEYLTNTLKPAEAMIFVKYRDEIAGRRAMDIGCGAGRITRYLLAWAMYVVGIDSSGVMIDYCERMFPRATFHLCDVRDVSRFDDASFDVAVFSFNGIDALGHDDRLVAFRGIRRILAPGGLFIFSSHNRHYRDARRPPELHFSRNPLTLLANVVRFGRALRNHMARRAFEQNTPEYALINDSGHDYTMVHYYIDRATQTAQLRSAGFDPLETYDEAGEVLSGSDDDTASGELYYVARRRVTST